MNNIFTDVIAELTRQEEKWGVQQHTLIKWHLILTEEWGEVSKEMNEVFFREKSTNELRKELIQTIAVAMRMIEEIDRV